MGEAGILGPRERVELIEGRIVKCSPKTVAFTATVNRLWHLLTDLLEERDRTVRKGDPVVLADNTEPEPDIAVVRGSNENYKMRQPGPADIILIVEVSTTTIRRDRSQKGRVYARAGVPEYWLVNLQGRIIEVYRDPGLMNGESGYRNLTLLTKDQTIAPINVPDAGILVRELLP